MLFVVVVTGGAIAGCARGPQPLADAVAVFDGGWVSRDDRATAASGQRPGTSLLPGAWGSGSEELARWIAREKLIAESQRPEVEGRRDFALRTRELEWEQLVPPLLAEIESAVEVSDAEIAAEVETIRADREERGTRLQLRHIFLRASDDVPEAVRQQKLAVAQRLVGELRGGASFEALARQHSESSNAANGGFIPALRRRRSSSLHNRSPGGSSSTARRGRSSKHTESVPPWEHEDGWGASC